MMKFQTKPNCQNSPRAFQSNKTLSVQTQEHFQAQCAGEKEIVWECTEGKGAAGAGDTWPLHLCSPWRGEGPVISPFSWKRNETERSQYIWLGPKQGTSLRQLSLLSRLPPLALWGFCSKLVAAGHISQEPEYLSYFEFHPLETPDSKSTRTCLFTCSTSLLVVQNKIY